MCKGEVMKIGNIEFSKINSNNPVFGHIVQNKAAAEHIEQKTVKIPLATHQALAFNGMQKDWIFLENINIPHLNLNANLYMMKNGQKVLLANKEGPVIIKTFFKVGSMNEPDNLRGISHYIEHNLFNGSKNFKAGEFVQKVNSEGARYNASTSFAITDYFIHSAMNDKASINNFIKLHADMLSSPLFSEDMLLKEKGPVNSEIHMISDNPENIAMNNSLKNLFQIKTKSSDLIGGSVENINNLTRKDVVDYYKNFYSPNNALTVIIGDIDEKEVLNRLNNEFKEFKNEGNKQKYEEPLNPIQAQKRTDIVSKNTQSNIINLAFTGPKNDEDKFALKLLLLILSGYKNSRLSRALKKYNIDASAGIEYLSNNPKAPTAIYINTSTPANEEEVLKTIYKTIFELSLAPVSDNELLVAKEKFKNSLNLTKESNMDIASFVGFNYILENNFNSLKNIDAKLNSITPKDIQLAAQKFLDLNKTSLTVVHPDYKQGSNISFGSRKKDLGKIQTYKTPNNILINTLNSNNASICTLRFDLQLKNNSCPSMNALLGKLLQKGSSIMSEEEFNNIEDTNNIEKEISPDFNKLKVFYSFPNNKIQTVMNGFKTGLLMPAITPQNFEKAKNELKSEYLSSPKQSIHRFQEEIFKNSPKENSARMIFESLDKINYSDFVNYYNYFMRNCSCKVTLCGDLRNNNTLGNVYNDLKNINIMFNPDNSIPDIQIPKTEKDKIIIEAQERNQADIIKGFRIKESGNVKDKAAILVLNEILGGNSNSRLFNDLREKQKLAYRVHSNYSEQDNDGVLYMRIFTTTDNSPENLKKSMEGFDKHIKQFIENDITPKELDAAKNQIKSRILFEMESTQGKNMLINSSMQSLYKENYLNEFFKALDNIEPQNVKTAARLYLTTPSVTSIIASKNTIEANKNYFNSIQNSEKIFVA